MLSIPKYPEQYAQHFPTIFYLLCCASQHHVQLVGPHRWGQPSPCRRSIGRDRRLGRTFRPRSRWARADGGRRPSQALNRQRPPPGQDSQSPQLVGPRLPGRTSRPPSWWARAAGGLPSPAGAP